MATFSINFSLQILQTESRCKPACSLWVKVPIPTIKEPYYDLFREPLPYHCRTQSTSVIKPSRTLSDPRGLGKATRTNLTQGD